MIHAPPPGRVFRLIIPCCLLAGVVLADGAAGSDTDSDAASDDVLRLENCVSTAWIRRSQIVDDRTIIFYMNQRKIFVNQLPHRCPGLRIAGAFSYRTTGPQLCNVDTIRVLRSMGSRVEFGPTCGLGKFRPVTEEEAAMIRNKEAELPPRESESTEDSGARDTDTGESDTDESGTKDSDPGASET